MGSNSYKYRIPPVIDEAEFNRLVEIYKRRHHPAVAVIMAYEEAAS